jgi:hypothetical protein
MMLNKWLVPVLAIFAIAFLTPLDASAQLGKKGDKGETKGGDAKGETKGNRGDRGEGKTSPPPTKNTGGGSSSGGGKVQPPPSKNTGGGSGSGGGKVQPPPRNNGGGSSNGGGQLGKGGSTSGGSGGSGGGKVQPPPTKNTGGSSTGGSRGGSTSGGSGGSSSGGGKVQPPPTRNTGGGKVQPPPTRNTGGGSGQLGKGSSTGGGSGSGGSRGGGSSTGGQVQPPPTRYQGSGQSTGNRGGGSSSGTLDRGRPNTQGQNGGQKPIDLRNEPFKKAAPARSGNTSYGSKNNGFDRSKPNTVSIKALSAPAVIKHSSRIDYDVRREDRTVRHREFRSGYCHYNPWWVDDWFYYPHYVFAYNPGYCYPSPFYYYPHVPGYISSVRVITGNFVFVISAQNHYNWRRPVYRYPVDPYYGGSGRYDLIDYQIDNIVTAFEQRRMYYLERMVPRDGYVHVALEDTDDYRMYSSDFYDMLADIVEGTDTVSYQVTDVRYDRNQYVVYAEHAYRDPWGGVDYKYHTIVMERDREGFEIRYFRVDR